MHRNDVLKIAKKHLIQEVIASTSISTQSMKDQNVSSAEINIIEILNNKGSKKKEASVQTFRKSFSKGWSKGMQCKLYSGVSIAVSPRRVLHKYKGTSPGLKGMPIMQENCHVCIFDISLTSPATARCMRCKQLG